MNNENLKNQLVEIERKIRLIESKRMSLWKDLIELKKNRKKIMDEIINGE